MTAPVAPPVPTLSTAQTSAVVAAPWLTVAQMAVWSGLTVKHVYAFAPALGGFRVPGEGKEGRWRFDPAYSRDLLREHLIARQSSERSQVPDQPATAGKRRAARKRSNGSRSDLLPVRGGVDG